MKKLYEIDPEDITQVIVPGGAVKRIIVCAANRYNDIVICGARHYDEVMNKVLDKLNLDVVGEDNPKGYPRFPEQGFIDQYQNFVTREDAAIIVVKNKQKMRSPLESKELFSENLY
ncbi:MAG: hypothetical protein GY810_01090 [Aureispira sp.]|nr:hypothetical protein [Aureispira sp.]